MHRLMDRVMEKYDVYMQERMGWARWEPKYVAWYDEALTEPQLRATIAFLKSDAGKAWLDFQSQIAVRMQAAAMDEAQQTEAKIKELMAETVSEVKAEIDTENAAKDSDETKPPPEPGH